MVSKEQTEETAAELHEKLQLLSSITNSHAEISETSIILDATQYIQELKQKIEVLNLDIETGETSSRHDQPEVVVEALENGFSVNIQCSEKSSPSLLVSIIAVFEELGLNVMEARASCTDTFQLEAIGRENEENGQRIDAQVVKETISDAIKNWRETNGQE